ncbi:MAG: FAD-dependent oxidoreductase, partial [Methanomicrobiales archaeon]|nr:FAD-dependent oxidoreductase [Methanomicrobiales archaeon]
SGVTVARLLHEKGHDVVVLEREEEIGGLCRSRTEQGFTFDRGGSHIIFSRDGGALAFMQGVLGENRTVRERNTVVFYRGREVPYPFENGLYALPKEDLYACIHGFIQALIAHEKGTVPPPANFREWIEQTFGKGIADCYLVPYNEKIWKYPLEEMSTHWVEGRIPRPPVEDVIRAAIGIPTVGYAHQAVFSYPARGGIEAMVRAIAAPLEKQITTGCTVRSVRQEGDEYLVSDGKETIRADRVVSTIPLQALLPCLADVPDPVQEACRNLKYNSLFSVSLGIRGTVPPISWMYVPEKDLGQFNRISFPSNYSDAVAPEGHASILSEITFREGDPVASMTGRQLVDHVVAGLCRMGILPSPDAVVYSRVEREPYAYVIYDLDYLHNIRVVRDHVEARGIDLLGRFARFEYLNMDACIRGAIDFAEQVPCA